MYPNIVPFETLKGKTIERVVVDSYKESIDFYCKDGSKYTQEHSPCCCEQVYIESIDADLAELLTGQEILVAEENVNYTDDPGALNDYHESYTWSFYKLATTKGWVTIRWYGTSNGYYSETVDLFEVRKPNESV